MLEERKSLVYPLPLPHLTLIQHSGSYKSRQDSTTIHYSPTLATYFIKWTKNQIICQISQMYILFKHFES